MSHHSFGGWLTCVFGVRSQGFTCNTIQHIPKQSIWSTSQKSEDRCGWPTKPWTASWPMQKMLLRLSVLHVPSASRKVGNVKTENNFLEALFGGVVWKGSIWRVSWAVLQRVQGFPLGVMVKNIECGSPNSCANYYTLRCTLHHFVSIGRSVTPWERQSVISSWQVQSHAPSPCMPHHGPNLKIGEIALHTGWSIPIPY